MFRHWMLIGAAVVGIVGCSSTPPPAAAPVAEPVAAVAPQSEASARAEALIEDMRRKEAALAKFDKENPPPPPPRLDQLQVAYVAPAAAPRATPTPAAAPGAPATTAPAAAAQAPAPNAGDEATWKERMRVLQVKLEDDTRLVQAALRQMNDTTLRLTYDQATAEYNNRRAAVENDLAAIDRLHDEARRANIPAGWLRWP